MEQTIKLRRGLNLHLEGEAQKVVRQLPQPAEVAVRPTDFTGLTPKLLVREGDEVVAGQALLTDKQSGRIHIPSPIGGRVKSVVRGDRRQRRRGAGGRSRKDRPGRVAPRANPPALRLDPR